MMITGVLMLDEPMTLAALKQVIQRRFLSYARFRQKPVDGPTGAYWQDDPDFDLDWHVRLSGLPGKGDGPTAQKRALQRFVGQLASSPLDPTSRCGSSTWSRATTAVRRSSRASTIATPTASRWCRCCCR